MQRLPLSKAGMVFSRTWFMRRNAPAFTQYVFPAWKGLPITYLELGVYEGMSMCWMCEHVLTHPDSRAVGVDPWLMVTKATEEQMDAVRRAAIHNTGFYPNCELIRGNSAEVLRKMAARKGFAGVSCGQVDLCLVDGSHTALGVLDDARLVWHLLRPGGWMLFDDVVNEIPKEDHVQEGLALFLRERGDGVRLLWKGRFVEAYEKVV